VGLALSVFAAGETSKRWAGRSKVVKWLLAEAMAFETYYRTKAPRTFAYYLFYPLFFPYWLSNSEARREFLMFRGYTLGSFLILLGNLAYDYFAHWQPELGFKVFLPAVALTLTVETFLVLSLLMPVATTVVWYHSTFRRRRLLVLLGVGILATGVALTRVASRRDPIVSYIARERVRLRTKAEPARAHETMIVAARAAWADAAKREGLDGDGKVEGPPLDAARASLQAFYKNDEAYAFDLWASPRKRPKILVLYFEARPKKPPIWVAIGSDGRELSEATALPKGAFQAMRRVADGTDSLLVVWPRDESASRPLGSGAPPSASASPQSVLPDESAQKKTGETSGSSKREASRKSVARKRTAPVKHNR
jgi:hypothetical protein